jgi:segregation and condensation protein B
MMKPSDPQTEAAGTAETAVESEAPAENDLELRSTVEAIIYAAEEPVTAEQMAAVLQVEKGRVERAIEALRERYGNDDFGVEVKPLAGGFRMATKPHHHEAVRKFIKSLKPPIRLSMPALETLAVIAYRQPVTAPEIRDIRGADPAGVLNTLLEKKLITTAGRKEVIGRPILYRTTRDFLVRFGLNGINELPTLKEFEEMTRAGLEGIVVEPEAEARPPQATGAGAEGEATPLGESTPAPPTSAGDTNSSEA